MIGQVLDANEPVDVSNPITAVAIFGTWGTHWVPLLLLSYFSGTAEDSFAVFFAGIFLLKVLPMILFGPNIKFDASMHAGTGSFFAASIGSTVGPPGWVIGLVVYLATVVSGIWMQRHNWVGVAAGTALGIGAVLLF